MTPSVVVRLLCRAGPVAGVLFLAPAPLLAQNLVTNPNFNTDLSTWQVSGGTFDATVDANASPSSGSVHIVQTVPGSNNASSTGVIQCIDGVVGGSTYNFGSKILLASAPAGGSVVTGLIFASGPGCGPPTQQVFSAAVTPGAGFQAANGTIVAPAGSQSVQISKFAITGANPGDFDMHVDDFFFQLAAPVPVMPIWMLSSLALYAVVALRRARRVRHETSVA
jgi:hypothetical protein